MTVWDFASAHYIVALLALWIVAWACVQPFRCAFRAYNRSVRGRNIAAHGWPVPPVDADGDIVYPSKKCPACDAELVS